MNAKPVDDPPRALVEPVLRHPPAPTPEPLRPAAGLILGLLLSTMLWLTVLVAWFALRG